MSLIFLVLFGVALLGVGVAVQDLLARRKERRALRARLGAEYDAYLDRRKRRRKRYGWEAGR